MKFKILYILALTVFSLKFYAQNNCNTSLPFCATSNYTFAAGVNNGSAAAGPDYGCLFTQPNPAWYYVQIAQSGPVVLTISGSGGSDVDVIAWGPFPTATGNCGNLTAANTIDCSYSASSTETLTLPNAQAGEFYQVLITNFSNQPQNINFNQGNSGVGGAGSTNCNFTSGVNSPSICPAATATLIATTSLVGATYSWVPGGATTQTVYVTPATTTVYSVTITGSLTAGGTQSTVVNTGTVTVLPTPTVNMSSNSMVCAGSPIVLAATPGFTSYTWTTPVSTQTTTGNSLTLPNANNSLVGTYTVLINSLQGCEGSATTTVDIIPTSTVSAPVPASACEGGVISLTSDAIGAIGYSWSGPGGYTSSVQNPTLTNVTLPQAGIYTVTAYFTGAGTNTCTTTNTTTVTIIPASTVVITPLSTICSNGTINLMAPAGGNSYSWNGPNGFTSPIQNPVINNAEVINQGIYSVSITASGCVRTGSVSVSVYSVLNYTTTPSDITLCQGLTANLTAGGTGGSGNYGYSWNPVTDLSNPATDSPMVTGNTTTTYTVTLSDANCAATQTVQSVVTVSVNPTPVITLGTKLRGCEPFSAPLSSVSNPPSASCAWVFSNNTGYNQCNSTGFMFPAHGVYNATLNVTDVNGCQNSITENAYVTVDPKPNADFTYLPTNPTVLINEVSFDDNSSIGGPMQNWHWNFGDYFLSEANDTSNVPNPSHVYDNAATYTVSLAIVNSFGCRDTVTKYINVEEEFALFIPNAFTPTKSEGKNDVFMAQGIGFLPETFTMAIYDRWGNLIYKTNDITKGWDGSIKGGKTVQGVYVYKITVQDFKKHDREFIGHITVL